DSYELLPGRQSPVSSVVLYEEYIRAWLRRELMTGRLNLDPTSTIAIVEDLAHYMVQKNTLILEGIELREVLIAILDQLAVGLDKWPDLHRQLITSTFVRRSSLDTWEFAHRSFQEFLYARKFFRWE